MPTSRLDYLVVTGIVYVSVSPWILFSRGPRLFLMLGLIAIVFARVLHSRATIGARPALTATVLGGLAIMTPLLTGDADVTPYVYIVASIFASLLFVCIVSFERFCDVYTRVLISLSALSLVFMTAGLLFPQWVTALPFKGGDFVDYRNALVYSYIVNRQEGAEGLILERNVGIAWEPGAFAVLTCLAALLFAHRNKTRRVDYRTGSAIGVLTAATVATSSVTGFVCLALILLAYFGPQLLSRTSVAFALAVLAFWIGLVRLTGDSLLPWNRFGSTYGETGGAVERMSLDSLGTALDAPWFPLGSSYSWLHRTQIGLWNSILASVLALGLVFALVLGYQYMRFSGLFGAQSWVAGLLVAISCSTQNFFVSPLFLCLAMFGAIGRFTRKREQGGYRRRSDEASVQSRRAVKYQFRRTHVPIARGAT